MKFIVTINEAEFKKATVDTSDGAALEIVVEMALEDAGFCSAEVTYVETV